MIFSSFFDIKLYHFKVHALFVKLQTLNQKTKVGKQSILQINVPNLELNDVFKWQF